MEMASFYLISLIIPVEKELLFPRSLIKSPRARLSLARTWGQVPLPEPVSGPGERGLSLARPGSRAHCCSQSVSLTSANHMAKQWERGDAVTRMGDNYNWAGRREAASPCRSPSMLFQKNLLIFKNTYIFYIYDFSKYMLNNKLTQI